MSDILLDDAGDIDLTAGSMTMTGFGTVATAQRLKQRLRLFLGEWFLDRERGIPFIQQIFVKRPNAGLIDAIFKQEIISDPAILELQEFELDLDPETRVLTLTFRALTSEGEINFSEIFGI